MVRKELSQEMQALLIFLRFGSINTDEREWLSPTEVFRRTGVKLSTQHKLIARWKKRSFLILKIHREGRKGVLTPEQVQWVTSIDTLQSMVHLSLKKRAMIVRDRYNLKTFDAMTLLRYYLKWKVKYIMPNYTYWKSFAEKNSLKEKQLAFVQQLGTIIKEHS
jgi:transposase